MKRLTAVGLAGRLGYKHARGISLTCNACNLQPVWSGLALLKVQYSSTYYTIV